MTEHTGIQGAFDPMAFGSLLEGPMVQGPAPYQRYREMSIEDMLLENRIIFMAGPITERTASLVIMRMLYLQSIKKDLDIHLYINCPGGLVDQTLVPSANTAAAHRASRCGRRRPMAR